MTALTIGIDLGGTHMRIALVDQQGVICHQAKTLTPRTRSELVAQLQQQCLEARTQAASLGKKVAAIGIGVAGKIDAQQGKVVFSPNIAVLNAYPLAEALSAETGLPVFLENDANAFGYGENWRGEGAGVKNWIGLTLGTGVGGCLILERRLWLGDNLGFVGELGHMVVDPQGPVCGCGSRGCLEAYASGSALLQGVAQAIAAQQLTSGVLYERALAGNLDPEDIYQSACAQDSFAQSLFERMGWALGLALANLFTILGINHAIIGGGVSAARDRFYTPLERSLATNCRMLPLEDMSIKRSQLGDRAALLGAAYVAWKQL